MSKKKHNKKSAIRAPKDLEVPKWNRAIYSAVDPTSDYPTIFGAAGLGLKSSIALANPDNVTYDIVDPIADAAWRKRLGLSYDENLLIPNKDGSYRLPRSTEREIPTDTTRLKRRIASNEKLYDLSSGETARVAKAMLKADKLTLDALRHTYATGEPVSINEFSHNSRELIGKDTYIDPEKYVTPLSVLKNYTVQYNPEKRTIEYSDIYDFNEFEPFVPGEPFDISGSIPLRAYGGPMGVSNKYSLGSFFNKAVGTLKTTGEGLTKKFMGSEFGQGLSKLGVKAGNLGGIANTAATAIGGLLAGKNETGVGKALQGIGSLASNIPGIGGLVGAGVNLVGGVVNAAFGSSLNKENIAKTEQQINELEAFTSNAGDYDALASNYLSAPTMEYFSKSSIGSDGWFSNKAEDKWKELREKQAVAEDWVDRSLLANALNISTTNQQLMEANYSAYGGPINMLYSGTMSPFGNQFKYGGIYIKPSKRGTFTAAAKKRGLGVQEFASKVLANKDNYSTAMVKKANFARNAGKWHDEGGDLDIRTQYYNRWKEIRDKNRRTSAGYSGGNFGGAGAYSIIPNSIDSSEIVKDTIWLPYKETFNDAFSRARKAKLDNFIFNNVLYSTELGDNPDNYRAGLERIIEGLIPIERTKKVKNKKAEGGPLTHGGIFSNGVEYIGNGGTHEDNINEGVQMGVDPQGVPNLVEEGELIWNDYVFSNRLKVPKAIRLKYKLRENITFAEAAKELQKESEERPNDPISQDGLNAIFSDLAMAQEEVRMKKESNKFAKGGKLGNKYEGEGNKSQYLQFYTPEEQTRNYYSSLLATPELSSFERPIGLMTPAERMSWAAKTTNAKIESTPILDTRSAALKYVDLNIKPINLNYPYLSTELTGATTEGKIKNDPLRYAPIIGHGLGVFSDLFSSPDYSAAEYLEGVNITPEQVRYTPIGNYLTYRPLDRDYYINKLNADAAATRRHIMNTSGGNRAAALAGVLAADYNYGTNLGKLARQAEEYNLAQRQQVEAFNRGTNMANSEMGLKAAMANADARTKATQLRMQQAAQSASARLAAKEAYNARRSNNINTFLEELGGLGTERTYGNWLDFLADAGILKVDSKGNYIAAKKSNGGKIKTKKKKGFTYG